jgi:hypothetical protein
MPTFIGSLRGTLVLTGVLLVVLAGLAGCADSGGGSGSAAGATRTPDAAAIWRELVQCARTHGMPNIPDPQIDSDGRARFPANLPDPPPSVERACKPIYDRLPASVRGDDTPGARPADIPKLVAFAACMRQHGIPDFPDPKADGNFPLTGNSLAQGKTPRLVSAMNACKQLNPDPKGGIHGSR